MEDVNTKLIGDVDFKGKLGKEVEFSVYDPMYVETNNQGGLDISLVDFKLKSNTPFSVILNIKATESFFKMAGDIVTFGDNQANVMILPEEYEDDFMFTEEGFRYTPQLSFGEEKILGADSASYVVQAHSPDIKLDTYQHFDTGADGIYGGYRIVEINGEAKGIYLSVVLGDDMMNNIDFINSWKYIFGIK